MCSPIEILRRSQGQATIEAAVLIPAVALLLGVLLQPAIVLYDKCVMGSAAAEGCRLAATAADPEAVEQCVLRRLAAIPHIDAFHIGGASWDVRVQAGELGEAGEVSIENGIHPLPLVGLALAAFPQGEESGSRVISASCTGTVMPPWLSGSDGGPQDWVQEWE